MRRSTDGYLDAHVTVRRATARPGVALCIDADRGRRIYIGEVKLIGAQRLPEAVRASKLNKGDVANDEAIEAASLYIMAEYWDHGMARVKVSAPTQVRHGDRLDLEFTVVEGEVYRYGEIAVAPGSGLALPSKLKSGDIFRKRRSRAHATSWAPELTDKKAYVIETTKLDERAHTISLTFVVKN